MQEWFRLERSLLNWNWFDKPEMLPLFMHLLNCANEEDKQGDVLVCRGQVKTSLNHLSDTTGISKQTLRTCLGKLKEFGLIKIEANNHYSVIAVCNFGRYLGETVVAQRSETKEAKTQKAKAEKPKKSKDELSADTEKRKKIFYQELVPYVETYGRAMVREFFDYWSEPNKSRSKMRYEQERTWDLSRRLARWANHNKDYKSNGSKEMEQRIGEATDLVNTLLSSQQTDNG